MERQVHEWERRIQEEERWTRDKEEHRYGEEEKSRRVVAKRDEEYDSDGNEGNAVIKRWPSIVILLILVSTCILGLLLIEIEEKNVVSAVVSKYTDEMCLRDECKIRQYTTAIRNDRPVFIAIENDTLTTGDLVKFRVNVTGNTTIANILLNFTVDGIDRQWAVTNNTAGDQWEISITLPPSAELLAYYFWANDTSGNTNEGIKIGPLPVHDNDLPAFEDEDNTIGMPTTGDSFTFTVNVSDNIAIHSVSLNYSFDNQVWQSAPMSLSGGEYEVDITMASDATTIWYKYEIKDTSDNWYNHTTLQKSVDDNDAPVFLGDATNMDTLVAGQPFTVSAMISDNIDTRGLTAEVMYNISGGEWVSKSLVHTSGFYYNYTFTMPADAVSFLYYFIVEDVEGNVLDTYVAMDIANKLLNPTIVLDRTTPVAFVGGDLIVDQGTLVLFDASGSSDNIGIVNYTWTLTYDGVVQKLYGEFVTFTFERAGTYLVWLRVTDAQSNWHTINMTVTVLDITIPMANPGPNQYAGRGSKVVFNASDSYDNVGIVNYTWTIDGETLYGVDVNYTFDYAGVYLVVLKVTDAAGNSHEANLTVTIKDKTAPIAEAGADKTVDMGTNVVFVSTGSSDNVAIATYTWTFKYGGGDKVITGTDASFTFNEPGVYTITLTVEDAAGNKATDHFLLTVRDGISPTIKVSIDGTEILSGDQHDITEGDKLTFDASGSSDNVRISSYSWDIDGETMTGEEVEYQFNNAGTITVYLTVTDATGNSENFIFDVKVTKKEEPIIPPPKEDGLSTSAIVGIVFGIIIVVTLIILFLVMVIFKKKTEGEEEEEDEKIDEVEEAEEVIKDILEKEDEEEGDDEWEKEDEDEEKEEGDDEWEGEEEDDEEEGDDCEKTEEGEEKEEEDMLDEGEIEMEEEKAEEIESEEPEKCNDVDFEKTSEKDIQARIISMYSVEKMMPKDIARSLEDISVREVRDVLYKHKKL